MSLLNDNQLKILNLIGIPSEMTELPKSNKFVRYVSKEYQNSSRKETDEVYNMFEITLLHKPSGIRLTLTSREDYFGDIIYKVVNLFVITTTKAEFDLIDVDFENRIIQTRDLRIPFEMIDVDI
jgi:hypothetical protein